MRTIQELKNRVKQIGMKYEELSKLSGIPIGTLKNIFSNRVPNPRMDTINAIEKALGLETISKFKDNDTYEEVEMKEHHLIPLLGSVVAGIPIESQEDIEGYIYIDQRPVSDYFALRVNGQSMKNVIPDKSIIIVRKQESADNGDIVVAMLNGEQTVKRFKRYGDIILLSPENQSFDNIPVTPDDDFHILGKVVESRNVF